MTMGVGGGSSQNEVETRIKTTDVIEGLTKGTEVRERGRSERQLIKM